MSFRIFNWGWCGFLNKDMEPILDDVRDSRKTPVVEPKKQLPAPKKKDIQPVFIPIFPFHFGGGIFDTPINHHVYHDVSPSVTIQYQDQFGSWHVGGIAQNNDFSIAGVMNQVSDSNHDAHVRAIDSDGNILDIK